MPYRARAEAILARWREIERALEKVEAGTAEAEYPVAIAGQLRDEYQRLVEEARRADLPGTRALPRERDLGRRFCGARLLARTGSDRR